MYTGFLNLSNKLLIVNLWILSHPQVVPTDISAQFLFFLIFIFILEFQLGVDSISAYLRDISQSLCPNTSNKHSSHLLQMGLCVEWEAHSSAIFESSSAFYFPSGPLTSPLYMHSVIQECVGV